MLEINILLHLNNLCYSVLSLHLSIPRSNPVHLYLQYLKWGQFIIIYIWYNFRDLFVDKFMKPVNRIVSESNLEYIFNMDDESMLVCMFNLYIYIYIKMHVLKISEIIITNIN